MFHVNFSLRGQALMVRPFPQALDGARFDVSVNASVGTTH